MRATAPDLLPAESDLLAATPDLLPAALAPYRDLSTLRYDYPLILTNEPPYVQTLTDVTNRALQRVAPRGITGERQRQHVMRLERALRRHILRGRQGSLTELWDMAAKELLAEKGTADAGPLEADLSRVKHAIPVDPNGMVADCDAEVGSRVVKHVWQALQDRTMREFGAQLDELVLGLSGILRADDINSPEAGSAENLRATIGGNQRAAFDFEAWSDIVRTRPAARIMPQGRRDRIRSALALLRSQRFFPISHEESSDAATPYSFLFDSCVEANAEFRRRLPAMVDLVRAMSIAELEIANRYREAEHDTFFGEFDEASIGPADIKPFPSYLVCLSDRGLSGSESAQLIDMIASDAPINVLVEVSDVLGDPPGAVGISPGATSRHLGRMAMSIGTAYALQTTSSEIPRVADRICDAINFRGPSVVSVFTGSPDRLPGISAYLDAAAALQSRTFPAFSYDPGAGPDWAQRFSIAPNPDLAALWPTDEISYEDDEMQRRCESSAFTVIDYAALDRRYVIHYEVAPPERSADDMEPAAGLINRVGEVNGKVPYILMATADDVLHHVVVDASIIRVAGRFADTWHSLQELGGVHNSHAEALLEVEHAKWEEQKVKELERLSAVESSGAIESDFDLVSQQKSDPQAPAGAESAGVEPVPPIPGPSADDRGPEPFIETARCTTCDECTDLNARMFAYDENKQAYIADLSAGSYREMVEAAEACQVAIIHPGQPWDPTESGLDELVSRAAAFA